MASGGELAFRYSYEICPITLVDGMASGLPGGALGVVSLLLGPAFEGLLLPGGGGTSLAGFPVTFVPLPGSTIIDNQIATYPLANIAVAANAIINQPLHVAMLMRIPASEVIGGYAGRAAVLQALQATLADHVRNEGTFVVDTPSFPWQNCLLVNVTDVSSGESKQPQLEWKWEFVQPLISAGTDDYSMNTATSDMASGGVTDGSTSGGANVTGAPSTVASPAAIPNNAGGAATIDNGIGGGAGYGGGSGGSPFSGARA